MSFYRVRDEYDGSYRYHETRPVRDANDREIVAGALVRVPVDIASRPASITGDARLAGVRRVVRVIDHEGGMLVVSFETQERYVWASDVELVDK